MKELNNRGLEPILPGNELPVALEYRDDIIGFVKDIFGCTPRPKQEKVLEAVLEHNRVCVRSPRGYGKTWIAAMLALWAIAVFPDVKVITTAPSWQQLTIAVWGEIHKWAIKGRWANIGLSIQEDKELTGKRLELHKNRVIHAVSSKESSRVEGTHADCVVIIVDEAKDYPQEMWDSLEGTFFSAEHQYYLAISTPGAPIGEFYNIQSRRPGYENWYPIQITEQDARKHIPGWSKNADILEKKWGRDSVQYKRHVAAEFAESEEAALIQLSWIEEAQKRWYEMSKIPNDERILKKIGMDVGGEGSSQSVLARLYDDGYVSPLEKHAKPDTQANVGYLEKALRESLDENNTWTAEANVDVIGIGVGTVDIAKKDKNLPVNGVNVSNRTKRRDSTGTMKFKNVRAWLGWALRERLDPESSEPLALPPDSDLAGELSALKIRMTTSGYQLESKEQFKRRYGKSPDSADALMLLMWDNLYSAKIQSHASNPFYD